MFWKKKKATIDPIAARLKSPTASLEETARNARRPSIDTQALPRQVAAMNDKAEMANYGSIDYLGSDDPKVLNFLREIGLEPTSIERVVITIENNQPVRLLVESYCPTGTREGSALRLPRDMADSGTTIQG